jgi:hypothetical protein
MRAQKCRVGVIWQASVTLAIVGALCCSACNKSSLKLYPVHGKVLYKGKPPEGAQVVFQPQSDEAAAAGDDSEAKQAQPMAYGTVAADGSFALRTEPHGEGAAPGAYKVLISLYGVDPRDPEQHISKLPEKYADPSNPVLKVTVKEENNELAPFNLN